MNNFRKIGIVVLILSFVFGLAACNNTERTGGDEIYVTVVDAGFGSEWMEAAADAYTEKTGVEVFVTADPDAMSTVNTIMGTNAEKEDLYFTATSAENLNKWAKNKFLEPLDDILSDTTYGTAATTRVADDTLLKLGKVDEAVYAIPYIYSNWGLIYNSALLEKIDSYGEYTKGEFPKTMQGLIDLCTATKNANLKNDVTGRTVSPFSCGISVLYMDNLFYALWYQQDPASWRAFFDQNNPDAFDRSTFDNETVREAISWVYDLMNPQKVNENGQKVIKTNMVSTAQNNTESQTSFINGDCVFTFCGTWFETEMDQILTETGMSTYHYTAYPTIAGGDKVYSQPNLPGEMFIIPSDAYNVAGAKDFVKFLLSEEGVAVASETLSQPLCFSTDKQVEFTRFGEEIRNSLSNAEIFYKYSDNDVFSTGALTIFKSPNPFSKMANCEFGSNKTTIIEAMVKAETDTLAAYWTSYTQALED